MVGEAKSSFVGDVAVRTVEDPEFLESRGRVNPCAVWELEAGGGGVVETKMRGSEWRGDPLEKKTHGKIK